MKPAPHVLPFRWILPIAQLLLCAVILWPMRSMLIGQIRVSLQEYGISPNAAAGNPVTPRLRLFNLDLSDPDLQRRTGILEAREWAVAALNMPGGLPDMAYAILSPAHSEWIPRGMLMWTWRDLNWPIVGIFFWWLSGRSVEALLFARHKIPLPRIRWWEVVVSLPVVAFGAFFAVCLCISQSERTEFPFWILLALLGSMWVVLGASTSLAYFLQWRMGRRLASASVEEGRVLTPTS